MLWLKVLSPAVRWDGTIQIISQRMSDWFSVLIIELSVEQPPTWPWYATDTRYSHYAGLLLPPAEGCGLWKRTFKACWQKKSIYKSFNAIFFAYHMWHMSCVTWHHSMRHVTLDMWHMTYSALCEKPSKKLNLEFASPSGD